MTQLCENPIWKYGQDYFEEEKKKEYVFEKGNSYIRHSKFKVDMSLIGWSSDFISFKSYYAPEKIKKKILEDYMIQKGAVEVFVSVEKKLIVIAPKYCRCPCF